MAEINKGKITRLIGYKAVVTYGNARNATTPPLVIPENLRPVVGIGTSVAFVLFDDATGLLLDRMDGEQACLMGYDR